MSTLFYTQCCLSKQGKYGGKKIQISYNPDSPQHYIPPFPSPPTRKPHTHTLKTVPLPLQHTNIRVNKWALHARIVLLLLGRRLNGSFLTRVDALSATECVLLCLSNNCCRAVNYRKKGPSENCELLHILASHHRELLEKNENYDYYVLLQPNRVRFKKYTHFLSGMM